MKGEGRRRYPLASWRTSRCTSSPGGARTQSPGRVVGYGAGSGARSRADVSVRAQVRWAHGTDLVIGDLPLLEVDLVANEEFGCVDVGRIQLDLLEPMLHVVVRVALVHVVHEDDAVASSIVRRSQGAKSFLTGGVCDGIGRVWVRARRGHQPASGDAASARTHPILSA